MPYKAGVLQPPSEYFHTRNQTIDHQRQYASSLEVNEQRDSRVKLLNDEKHVTDVNVFAKNAQQTLVKKNKKNNQAFNTIMD